MPEMQKVRHAVIKNGKTEYLEYETVTGTRDEARERRAKLVADEKERLADVRVLRQILTPATIEAVGRLASNPDPSIQILATVLRAMLRVRRWDEDGG